MIQDEGDFVSICDYLFYAQHATANRAVMQLYRKVTEKYSGDPFN